MRLFSSFIKTVTVLVALAACVCAQTPPDNAAPKSEARKRIVTKTPAEFEAAATTRVAPIIPDVARWAGESGGVTVQVLINEQGEVIDIHALYGPALLENAAVTAVRGWKFKPFVVDGTAVKAAGNLRVQFPEEPHAPNAPADQEDEIAAAKAGVQAFANAAEAYYWLGRACADEQQN